jgi:hypothetical protein
MIYGTRSNGNLHGLVITKPVVVNKMLDLVGYVADNDLSLIRIVEPAAGDGAFASSIVNRLYQSSLIHGFDLETALSNLSFFELDPVNADLLKSRIENILNPIGIGLPDSVIKVEDFLLSNTLHCDIVIGNPPYVRHENIPQELKEIYRRRFKTFTHRSDLYIAFYEKGLTILKESGILSFICSNRWLKNQYGKKLRHLISSLYTLEVVIDMENSSPFEEEVTAYPAITNIRKNRSAKHAGYYLVDDINALHNFSKSDEPNRILNLSISDDWFSSTESFDSFSKYLDTIPNQGFKIGIGVATGCDNIFIGTDLKDKIEPELVLPILMSKDLKGNKLNWSGNYIINPFTGSGSLICLDEFPKAKSYFGLNKEILLNRHIAKKNAKHWLRTIDKISVELVKKDKILLPDISGNSQILLDRGNFYPHHNIYYITGQSFEKLVLLAAVLMSDFVRDQLLQSGNKMNGGYPRWQSQNLRKLSIPIIDAMPKESQERLIEAYHQNNIEAINSIIKPSQIAEYEFQSVQTKLFEPTKEYNSSNHNA